MINIAITTTNLQDKDKIGEAPCGKKSFTSPRQASRKLVSSIQRLIRKHESSGIISTGKDHIALISALELALILALDCAVGIISTGQIIWQDRLLVRQVSVLLKTTVAMSQLLCKLSRHHVWSKSSVCTCVSTPQVFIQKSRRLPKIPTLVT